MTTVTVHGDSIRVEKTRLQEYKYSNKRYTFFLAVTEML